MAAPWSWWTVFGDPIIGPPWSRRYFTGSTGSGASPGSGDLGDKFGRQSANPSSVVGEDFVASIAAVTVGVGCPQADPNPDYATGGFDSCGCDTVISWDIGYSEVAYHTESETWDDIQDESLDLDATGTGYYEWVTQCNYDLSTYKFSNP
jgi:hypothetical protein